MSFVRKLFSKIRASLYVFRRAEVLRSVVDKESNGQYDNLCHICYFNERYQEQARQDGEFHQKDCLSLSIYLGGALGDYIVYLRFVDEISSVCDCTVDIFLDRMEFAEFVYGKREHVTIVHDAQNCLFRDSCDQYDMALHLDHGVTVRHVNLGNIRDKAPAFYKTACRIVEYTRANQVNIDRQNERESVILRRAKFMGESKWSKLSCGGVIDMADCYSNILLDSEYYPVLKRYDLEGRKYITVNFGADKNMGGTAQTKVLPSKTIEAFIAAFKASHPDYLVVQTGVKNSLALKGVDRCAFQCQLPETAIVLKYSTLHVDSEGGLVHLAAQMSTPSVVSFGPTPVYYYGYARNENIVSPVCGECMSVTNQWSKVCPRGMQVPACMQAITADMILERVEKLIKAEEEKSVVEQGQVKLDALYRQYIHGKSDLSICLIGELTEEMTEVVRQLRKKGHTVSLFIPLELTGEIVEWRGKLRTEGVAVEYGSPLNIARPNGAFDLVYCEKPRIPEGFEDQAVAECARLAKPGAKVLWCEAETAEV